MDTGRTANSKIKMEREDLVKDEQSNAAGKRSLTDQRPGRNIILLRKFGRKKTFFSSHKHTGERRSGFLQTCALIGNNFDVQEHIISQSSL